ncbi:hypothetical protein A2851_01915 [Candidatus Kaiserbacteria bacterium RIFCSPHIGHO2_01_FULL_53_29]|uniref:Uncharacterized protein n=1 Tax=Candidatus Kaiserbacteria bacterium RIFCSPHIGHO2_01_FULL_53_29 TaxID=1798480 RepID=A0A1F6CWT7_9BACT|nr:MAG: hypothetical protein A2851_01915 [Candidatus Kaiserbacteria bacterium RIFCSPHIGHO2_01_FULL_53_29]
MLALALLIRFQSPFWQLIPACALLFAVVLRNTVRGWRHGYRHTRNRNGTNDPDILMKIPWTGHCFDSGFNAGVREWKRAHQRD